MLFPLFLLAAGVCTGFRLRFFCFLHPIRTWRTLLSREKSRKGGYSPLRALTVSLAGTLGVGNITGVAAAISLGGAGALFWMWFSALATMLIKYAEIVLAVRTRECRITSRGAEYHGGPMRYLRLLPGGRILSAVFCVLCIFASFIQGNLIQTNAAASCAVGALGLPPVLTAAGMTALAAVLMFGGRDRIGAFTEKMIPFMTALYFLAGLAVIVRNAALLPGVFADIFRDAFSLRAAAGGGGGSLMLAAMRHGCAKGVFSHEAGCGTAPISHAGAETDSAHRQGLLGIAEVAADTLVLCTVTGLVLLLSGCRTADGDYAGLVIDAFSVRYGGAAALFLTVSVMFYAFATLVCWSFYGTECLGALISSSRAKTVYLLLFSLCSFLGAFVPCGALWRISDLLTVSMTVINTAGVFLLTGRVKGAWNETEEKSRYHVRNV